MPEDFADDELVLRSVNLQLGQDRLLREMAYRLEVSKSDLIRASVSAILGGLHAGLDRNDDAETRAKIATFVHEDSRELLRYAASVSDDAQISAEQGRVVASDPGVEAQESVDMSEISG